MKHITKLSAFPNLITSHLPFLKTLQQLEKAAKTNVSILLLGETGTGKELIAEAIHEISNRKQFPFVKVNCATLTDSLIESELFGHERGAFTGAVAKKKGRFELANRGTIFLDEVGELPLSLQPKLLRVLQNGTFERVGAVETLSVDVRVIAATNQDLDLLVDDGKFRRDLYFRLNAFPFHTIPLRERKEDIPTLARFFIKEFSQEYGKEVPLLPRNQLGRLINYSFPGNIRELKNIIQRAVILFDGQELDLQGIIPSCNRKRINDKFPTFVEMQRQFILSALERTNWRVSGPHGAAKLLGLNPNTLVTKMKRLGIKRPAHLGNV